VHLPPVTETTVASSGPATEGRAACSLSV
ncbi:ABC transporter ATP-binding protein, partial [Streptomyces sp. SID5910]|nr:ABC transporter ATP-binding protein [Streptomyces sp. SID5910]